MLNNIAQLQVTRKSMLKAIENTEALVRVGRVCDAFGTLIRVTGIDAKIGELCELRDPYSKHCLLAEVVGITGHKTLLTPLGSIAGVSASMDVFAMGSQSTKYQLALNCLVGLLTRIVRQLMA